MDLLSASRGRAPGERWLDLAFAASVWSWAVLGLVHDLRSGGPSVVRLAICGQQLAMGWLFAIRSPLRVGSPRELIAVALPSLLFAGISFRLADSGVGWAAGPELLFVLATGWATVSLLQLGRSFAILPGLRAVVSVGPYRCMRHPAYFGELLMVGACGWAAWLRYGIGFDELSRGHLGIVVVAALTVITTAVRIHAEERLCRRDPDYRRYAERVRWRLIPGVW